MHIRQPLTAVTDGGVGGKPYIRIVPCGYLVICVMTSWQVDVHKDPHLPAVVDDNLTTCFTKTPTYCSCRWQLDNLLYKDPHLLQLMMLVLKK